MGKIEVSYIMPHPPIVVPEVGKGEESGAFNTVSSFIRAAEEISQIRPDTIILTTPHGPVFSDFIHISSSELLSGNFSKFGAAGIRLQFANNLSLVDSIVRNAASDNIPCGGLGDYQAKKLGISRELDHGALVPLYFISRKYSDFKLVHIAAAFLPPFELYRFGMSIARAVADSDERVVFIASGDLSHRLSEEGPYGYNAKGPLFDEMLVQSIKTGQTEKLLEMDEGFCEAAGECGLRSFIMLLGALEGHRLQTEVYSYEGPFGVGYAVARIDICEAADVNTFEQISEKRKQELNKIRNEEDAYVKLARNSLESYVGSRKIIALPEDLPDEMVRDKAGVFVSIKKQGRLRGCIGTTGPTRENVAGEIIYNAISSGTQDPRFDAVTPEELNDLVYSVDILSEAQPVKSLAELDVIRYGVIVQKGRRSGLLLPNLDGVDTPEQQVEIALQKAGIRADETYRLERFEVVRHK